MKKNKKRSTTVLGLTLPAANIYIYIYISSIYNTHIIFDCILTGQLGMFARPRTAASENVHSSPFPSKYVILPTTIVKLGSGAT